MLTQLIQYFINLYLRMIEKIKKSANFMEAYQTVRQVGLAKLDMGWHIPKATEVQDVGAYERELQKDTYLLAPVEGTSTIFSFYHIFKGGYDSGY